MMMVLDVIQESNQNRVPTYNVRGKGETSVEKLLDKILSHPNLNLAYQRVYQNRGIGGVDEMDVFGLKGYLRENGEAIKELIRKRKYKPQPVLRVEIPKDNGDVRLFVYLRSRPSHPTSDPSSA